ncbi:hypothetical protein CHS0354_018974 [Potamilus streckersoni]|uniref:Uncharacterized protein n=1 Tax=Potamilus streckersoni TaxID=2493646 RepID=A0AAE0SMK3_9BIVA|nr:hypothetical protein CHS0354_018974 [Potamilus streckersoni]
MLQIKATTDATRTLIRYLCSHWLGNPVFSADAWSVYRQNVRTNNDVEVLLLRREADLVRLVVQCNDLGPDRRKYTFGPVNASREQNLEVFELRQRSVLSQSLNINIVATSYIVLLTLTATVCSFVEL